MRFGPNFLSSLNVMNIERASAGERAHSVVEQVVEGELREEVEAADGNARLHDTILCSRIAQCKQRIDHLTTTTRICSQITQTKAMFSFFFMSSNRFHVHSVTRVQSC